MVSKKKPFVDKKRATTYHLVCTDSSAVGSADAAAGGAQTEEERLQARVFARVAVRA